MRSGTQITTHTGTTSMKIRVHLGLKIPNTEDKNNSYLRVTDHFRHWQDGKMIIFDDSFDHEVGHYRVFKLDLSQTKHLLGHQKYTFKS